METNLFDDEIVMILEISNGLAIISCCYHVGIISMCNKVKHVFGKPVTSFERGTHLINADAKRIKHICDCLKLHGMKLLGACN